MKTAVLLLIAIGLEAGTDPALDHISAASMRGNLSFLSSDLLEGRDTPSRGLDIAAEFIAGQFRRAGLEPIVQTADYVQVTPDMTGFSLTIGHLTIEDKVDLQTNAAIDIENARLYKVGSGKPPSLAGKVAVLEIPDARGHGGRENIATYRKSLAAVKAQQPAAILLYFEGTPRRSPGTRLVLASEQSAGAGTLTVSDPDAAKVLAELSDGLSKTAVSIHAKAPSVRPVKLRNVGALLKGSDPALADTYVLLTAHYDHVGVKPDGEGDRIFNGANDDGSGTVSVIEIASALATMKPAPRRSILFLTFFGEEKGLFGSRYYAQHPLFPLDHTVAQINLEQLGRTDDNDGPQVGTATLTGFDFSDVPAIFEAAGKATGVKVYDNKKTGDAFFSRSDNQSLADAGVPAHTLAVSFEFPDYHQVGDEWQKIDYENMAKVDRMVALGLIDIAERASPPKWNESNPKAEKYIDAWKSLHAATAR
jgi:hypothetical protein